MRLIFIILLLLVITNTCFSQEILDIKICEQFTSKKHSKLITLSIIIENDTFPIPKVSKNKYLNPLIYYSDKHDFNSEDSVSVILENCKFYYPIIFFIEDLNKGFIDLCIGSKRNKFKNYEYNYTNYDGRTYTSFINRIRK